MHKHKETKSTIRWKTRGNAQIIYKKQASLSNINTDSIPNSNSTDNPVVIDNDNNKINYFLPGPMQEDDNRESAEITQCPHREFKDVFKGIRSVNCAFILQTKPDSEPYPGPPEVYNLSIKNCSRRN